MDDIKDVKEQKGFWIADAAECLLDENRFKPQCEIEYFCKSNRTEPQPKKIKCKNGGWDPTEIPTCKRYSIEIIYIYSVRY